MRAVIIDDEEGNVRNLALLLERYCPEVQLAGSALSAEEGKRLIGQLRPDLVLLDIQMPGKSGFEMLAEIPSPDFALIFVTAYDNYGIQAIKFSAIDYLLKPVSVIELQDAIRKASSKKMMSEETKNLLALIAERQRPEAHRIALATQKETRFVLTREIIRSEASNNYSTFFLENGEKLLVAVPMHDYEIMLAPYGFIRCHQSHLVNSAFVKSMVHQDGGSLRLADGSLIPVSRQKKQAVKDLLSR